MTMTGREHAALLKISETLKKVFQGLAAQRHLRQELLTRPDEFAWQRFEILGMLAAVNAERAHILGKPPVTEDAIRLAEQQACGHSDYAAKFPFYCAEIVYGVFPLCKERAS